MKLPFWATILTVMGVVFLFYMGVWQVNRLHWKQGILESIDLEYQHDAAQRDLSELLNDRPYFTKNHGIGRGFLIGRFAFDKSILLGPRVHNKEPGYHILTPFEIAGQKNFILVNRGWVPFEYDIMQDSQTEDSRKITGTLMAIPKDNSFVPDNIPEKEEWYRIDRNQIQQSRNIDNLYDLILYEEAQGGKSSRQYPVPSENYTRPNNNHMQYAAFWFIMTLILAGMYILRFVRKS